MTRARTIIEEVDPDCWNGTVVQNPQEKTIEIKERIGDYIDEEKPYTMVSAFIGRDSADEYLYINENRINWDLCSNLKVDIDVFENTYAISNERFKKIYKMKNWYIALK